jgi:uroporphyrinogen-III synthase
MQLNGKRVLITRPRSQAETFGEKIRALGAIPVYFPVITIAPVPDPTLLDRALHKLQCYDWVTFTSVNGVEAVWERMQVLALPGIPQSLRVAAIGPKTADALNEKNVSPDYIPDEYVAEALLPGMGDLRGRWVLLPRADLARPALAEGIRAAGGIPHEVTAYLTLPEAPDPEGLQGIHQGVDLITFTSSSTVRNFVALMESHGLDPFNLPGYPQFVCIGPITAQTAYECGFPVERVAEEYTIEGLISALEAI